MEELKVKYTAGPLDTVYRCGCYAFCMTTDNGGHRSGWMECNLHESAPELLGACKTAVDALKAVNRWFPGTIAINQIRLVEQAIEKAEGRS